MQVETMDAATLKEALVDNDVVVVDVREPSEYEEAHILNTVLIPLSDVTYDAIPHDATKKLVIHCRSGKRSQLACEKLLKERPELQVYNLEGGILAWIALGYPVESASSAM
ncbi:MAG: rhodanese-like domain-containing protein [Legionellaceae bacterium]|nr:rhodanese-like domain-containing protein [Legionellaceae bacterium]